MPSNHGEAPRMFVTLTVAELDALLRETVRGELARVMAAPAREVLTLTDVAEFLQRTRHRVLQMVRDEGLPAHSISPRELRFRRSELLAWVGTLPTQPGTSLPQEATP